MEPRARERFLNDAPIVELRSVLEISYASDLVNALIDLRHSTVKDFFERMVSGRRRLIALIATLYHYKVYLTDPVPLEVAATNGEKLPNYYAVLGLPRDAWPEEVDEAYKLLSRAFAPDSFPPADQALARKNLDEITEAFEQLHTPKRREVANGLLPSLNALYPRREACWLESVKGVMDY